MYKVLLAGVVLIVLGVLALVWQRPDAPQAPETLPAQVHTVRLVDGTYLGFIRSVSGGTAIAFDDAVWLTGEAGEDAAIAAGLCDEASRAECLPNGFFIENVDHSASFIALGNAVRVVMQTYGMEESGVVEPREIDLNTFERLVNDTAARWNDLPYEITVEDGAVDLIEEVYVP